MQLTVTPPEQPMLVGNTLQKIVFTSGLHLTCRAVWITKASSPPFGDKGRLKRLGEPMLDTNLRPMLQKVVAPQVTWNDPKVTPRMTKTRIAIDPGKSGAIAVLDGPLLLDVVDIPITVTLGDATLGFDSKGTPVTKQKTIRTLDARSIFQLLESWSSIYSPDEVWIEKIDMRPGVAAHSGKEMGIGVGILLGCFAALGLHQVQHFVTPSTWKRRLKVTADKATALAKARELWPDKAGKFFKRQKDDGRAEAALIGYYGHLAGAN